MANGSDMNVALRFQADVSQARAELKALRADAEAVGQGAQKINTAPIDKLSGSAKQAGNASKGMGAAAKTASAETKALADASAAATAAAQAQGKAVSGAAKANQAAAISAKQHAQAMRMLPMQMTDITVGLSTGQSPFMVMMQQGGQLKDMFGGIAPAAKAVGGSVMGMVNPLTVTAAAVAVLIAGYAKGSKESDAFNQSIVMTGNAVGSTTSQLAGMSGLAKVDQLVGIESARAQLESLQQQTDRIFSDQARTEQSLANQVTAGLTGELESSLANTAKPPAAKSYPAVPPTIALLSAATGLPRYWASAQIGRAKG